MPASGTEGLELTSLEGSKVEGGVMVQYTLLIITIILLTTITTVLLHSSAQQTGGPCPGQGTSCILRHLLSQGLIRDSYHSVTESLSH